MRIAKNAGFLSFTALLVAMTGAGPLHAEEIGEIPRDKCTPPKVVMAQDMAALDRTIAAGKASVQLWNKIEALVQKHPEAANRPIGAVLTAQESEEFNRTSERIASNNLYRLAESRLERDSTVMLGMLDAARKMKDGARVPPQTAPEWKYYAYLAALRDTFQGEEMKPPGDRSRCSFALAFFTDSDDAAATLTSSREVRDFEALRVKYGISDSAPADVGRMSAADATRWKELRTFFAEAVPRNANYLTDLYGIWQFSQMASLQYEMQKAEILTYGGAADPAQIEQNRTGRYNALSKQMQTTWNIWRYVDNQVPAQFANDLRELKKAQGGAR
jgi:hypothetical protein